MMKTYHFLSDSVTARSKTLQNLKDAVSADSMCKIPLNNANIIQNVQDIDVMYITVLETIKKQLKLTPGMLNNYYMLDNYYGHT